LYNQKGYGAMKSKKIFPHDFLTC